MKLLILTQKIDQNDDVLGFFHGWLKELSCHYEIIVAVCLEKGEVLLPKNVKVLSLGKEKKRSRLMYIVNFYRFIWTERKNYDAVFIHMNQEYVLLGFLAWKILGKKIFLWRNHPHGSFTTRLAVAFSDKVFCTSQYSYTACFKKTTLMPVGVDTDFFMDFKEERRKNSFLMLGRISPIKGQDFFIRSLGRLVKEGASFSGSIVGAALPQNKNFEGSLKEMVENLNLGDRVSFAGCIPNIETALLYNKYEIVVNATPSGSYDKTILESMSCGCLPLVSNKNLKGEIDSRFIFEESDEQDFIKKVNGLLALSTQEKGSLRTSLRTYVVEKHSLKILVSSLVKYI